MQQSLRRSFVRGLTGLALLPLFDPTASAQSNTRVSLSNTNAQADSASWEPFISYWGRHTAFTSAATNLVGTGVDTNGVNDVFARDRIAKSTVRISVDSS